MEENSYDTSEQVDMCLCLTHCCSGGKVCCRVSMLRGGLGDEWKTFCSRLASVTVVMLAMLGSGRRSSELTGLSSCVLLEEISDSELEKSIRVFKINT